MPSTFEFRGYKYDENSLKIEFYYRIAFKEKAPLDFTETLVLPANPRKLPKETLEKFLDPLYFALGVSYYKLYFSEKIVLDRPLSREQANFFSTLYRRGLGEYLYKNGLDPKKTAKFPHVAGFAVAAPARIAVKDRPLVGIGGGKDSIVVSELMKNMGSHSFLVETQKADPLAESVIGAIGNPALKIRRVLDPKIFAPHEGAYNGHIPISAIFAFVGLLAAALYDFKYVVVGNEQSSNFGNVTYKGDAINHQWSKSAEFETLAQNYIRAFVSPDLVYFSLLRPFNEIRVVELFARYPKYLNVFSSCNRNFRVNRERPTTLWCGECPKCAFVFLMLAPFLGKKELRNIFNKNLFADPSLVELYGDLLGFGKMKPFDCVGTFDEARAALYLAAKKYGNDVVIKKFINKIKGGTEFVKNVFKTVDAPTLPDRFKLLGIKNVCLLGYDKEGRMTEKYLRAKYPQLKIGILDKRLDKDYLKKQDEYDLAIKTPGMPKRLVTIPYTTATNLFFDNNKNFTIGVTGSKGKSTTSSLIYHILKTAGKKAKFFGNIGAPMLEALLAPQDPETVFVLELSSYMLDDIRHSPNIAVLLNLFPEHMDYHGGVKAYYEAKRNIFAFQKPGDRAVKFPLSEKLPLKASAIPLIGKHNLKNVEFAVRVSRLLGISDAAIVKAVKSFVPLRHRLEKIGTFKGITFYDDAISTTPESTIMAIDALKKVDTIMLGGEDRGYDFKKLEKTLRAKKIKNVVLFPDTGKRMLASRQGFNILETRSMKQAVKFAYAHTAPGRICLLSTASPSYSLWKNFEEKGDEFAAAVRALA
jgi:UDP-N-acetylmuramoylalanine--D-glutamate ligase